MSRLTKWMDATFYGACPDDWDNKRFRKYVLDRLEPNSQVLDFGAGRGAVQEMDFQDVVAFVAGIDPDASVLQNPFLHEAKVLPASEGTIPYPASSFDVVFANNVLEHLEQPDTCFEEIHRVLRPNGLFIGKTPNKRHYIATIARLSPYPVHKLLNEIRGRRKEDTFPTLYRCNTPERITSLAVRNGFEVVDVGMWEGRPEYLRISAVPYLAGLLYERAVNGISSLARFRCVIVFTLRKAKRDRR